jgi:predicted HTH domain antitoxin
MVERSILASGKGKRMDVIIHIPKGIEEHLEAAFGRDLAQAARAALAIEGYRTERLSLGQVAELLGVSTMEADRFLKERQVPLLYTIDDFERDRKALRNALAE